MTSLISADSNRNRLLFVRLELPNLSVADRLCERCRKGQALELSKRNVFSPCIGMGDGCRQLVN